MSIGIGREQIFIVLQQHGFSNVDARLRMYAESWQRGAVLINIKKTHDSNPMVVHPRHEAGLADLQAIDGVIAGERLYCHNSQFAGFPSRRHTGRTETRYGIDFGFESVASLEAFLGVLSGQSVNVGQARFDSEAMRFLDGFMAADNPQFVYWLPRFKQTLARVREALSRNAPEALFELVWKSRDNAVSNAGRGRMGHAEAERNRERLTQVIADIAPDGSPGNYARLIERFEEWRAQGELVSVPRLLVARAFAAIHPERYHTTVDAAKQDRITPWFVEHTGFVAPEGDWATKATALSAHLVRCGVFGDDLERRNMFPWFVFEQMRDASGKVSFRPGHTSRPASGEAQGRAESRTIEYRHNVIQDRLAALLCERHGENAVGTEHPTGTGGRADALVRRPDGRYELYEIKPSASAADAVRQAMGQLLEYGYRRGGLEPVALHVVSDAPMDDVTLEYLQTLEARFGLELGYMQVASRSDEEACHE